MDYFPLCDSAGTLDAHAGSPVGRVVLRAAFHVPENRGSESSEEQPQPRGATIGGATFGRRAKVQHPRSGVREQDVHAKPRHQSHKAKSYAKPSKRSQDATKGDPPIVLREGTRAKARDRRLDDESAREWAQRSGAELGGEGREGSRRPTYRPSYNPLPWSVL